MKKDKIELLADFLNKLEIAKHYIVDSDITDKEENGVSIKILKCEECYNKEFYEYTIQIELQRTSYNMVIKICDSFYGYFINENEKYYTVGCVIPINHQFELDEYDRSANAIDLYKSVFNQKDNDICIDETGIAEAKVNKGIRRYCYSLEGASIEISGDIDFNFKFKHIKNFEDILLNVKYPMKKAERRNLIQLLWCFYSEMTYSPDNISIMPRTGALNNIKKSIGDDRLDTFLFALKLYYEEGYTSFILSAVGGLNSPYVANRNLLKNFLDLFNDNENKKNSINNYCKHMYHISEELVEALCISGKKPIDTPERVKEYLELAEKFWKNKNEFYKSSECGVQSQYQKMIKIKKEATGKKYINTFNGSEKWECTNNIVH